MKATFLRTAAASLLMPLALAAQDPKTSPELIVKDGVAGSAEGHALAELQYWISWGDFDLAEAAYRIGCRESRTPSVRLLRSWALLRWAVVKKKDFDRVLAALEEIPADDAALRDHAAALARSVRTVMPCVRCDGKGRIRCTVCHGARAVRSADDDGGSVCGDCEEGHLKCPNCEGPRAAPGLEDVCATAPCRLCDRRGLLFKAVRVCCPECRGLGLELTPKADAGKRLP